ncbi:hypothetical protein [Streptomyces cinereoruber]|uniref:hypothetical protein n=1 Tax=Streptomyces cinereoruber TaxID=67260 RepID=UPI003630C2E1
MTRPKIEIQPAVERRVDFARWAVAQDPKIRTVGPTTFAVPADLYANMPESILIGARIDGHRYVSPEEDAAEGRPGPGGMVVVGEDGPETVVPLAAPGGELLGVATASGFTPPEREAVPGEVLPDLPAEAYGPDAVPLEPADSDRSDSGPGDAEPAADSEPLACDVCGKPAKNERGLEAHRRQKHPEA